MHIEMQITFPNFEDEIFARKRGRHLLHGAFGLIPQNAFLQSVEQSLLNIGDELNVDITIESCRR